MKKSGPSFLLTVVPLVAGLTACGSAPYWPENASGIKVIDLKVQATPVGWKDNETIVIVGDNGERYTRKDGAIEPVLRVMALNYRTGERQVYGKFSSEFCFAQGYVSYIFVDKATNELWASYGELGKEVTRQIKRGDLSFDRGPAGSCRPWNERGDISFDGAAKVAIWQLWPRLGILNCQVPSPTVYTKQVKARFHRPDDQVGVELPFSCFEVYRGFHYYEFKNAYFALEFDLRTPWPEVKDRRAFWLHPDGRVDVLTLPYSDAVRQNVIPTVAGIIGFGRPASRDDDYWIYFMNERGTKRVLRGYGSGVTSPNGCKAAILHDPNFAARSTSTFNKEAITLKVLDVCGNKS